MRKIIWKVRDLAETTLEKVKIKYDDIILVTGGTGVGKSTLVYRTARAISILDKMNTERFLTKKFTPKEDLIYDQNEVYKELNVRRKRIIISDEAINVAFNREWYQDIQKKIIKAINMNRDHQNIIFFCIPEIESVDKKLLSSARMWIDVIERGLGIIHIKSKSRHSKDKWDMQLNERIERKYIDARKPIDYTKMTTYAGHILFKPLSPKQEETYQKIKNEKRAVLYQEETGEVEEEQKPYFKVFDLLMKGEIKDKAQFLWICGLLNINVTYAQYKIREFLNEAKSNKRIKDFFTDNLKKEIEREKKELFKAKNLGLSQDVAELINQKI